MARATSPGGMIPEQVWDADPLPERGLYPGQPSGSAMPLVWAHAEFLKLLWALQKGEPLERLSAVAARYATPRLPEVWHWRSEAPLRVWPGGILLVEAPEPFTLHLGFDGWQGPRDLDPKPLGLSMHGVNLSPSLLLGHATLEFTRRFATGWEGKDHKVDLKVRAS